MAPRRTAESCYARSASWGRSPTPSRWARRRCCRSCTRTRATRCRAPAPTALLGDLDADAIDALVGLVGPGSGSPFLSVELRHLGGALEHPAPGAGALATLNGTFAMFAVGIVMDEDMAAALDAHGERLLAALAEHDHGRYLNFTERPTDTRVAYSEAAYARLQEAKTKWDADGLFSANHPINAGGNR